MTFLIINTSRTTWLWRALRRRAARLLFRILWRIGVVTGTSPHLGAAALHLYFHGNTLIDVKHNTLYATVVSRICGRWLASHINGLRRRCLYGVNDSFRPPNAKGRVSFLNTISQKQKQKATARLKKDIFGFERRLSLRVRRAARLLPPRAFSPTHSRVVRPPL